MVSLSAVESPETEGARAESALAGPILRNFASLAAGRFLSQLIGFFTNAYLARRIAPAGFGAIGLAQAAMTYLGIFSDAGLGTIALREGSQHPERMQSLISTITGFRLLLALAMMAAGVALAGFFPFSESSRSVLRIYALTLPIQALAVDWVFRALQRMHYQAVMQVFVAVATLALVLALVRQPGHLFRVPVISLITGVAAGVLGAGILWKLGYVLRPAFEWGASRGHLARSIPLCASALAITLYSEANSLILGGMSGDRAVGLYSAALRLNAVLAAVVWLYYMAMAPALMRLYTTSAGAAASLFRTSVRVTAAISMGLAVLVFAAGVPIMRLTFGDAFSGSAPVFQVMVWTAVVIAVGHNWGELAIAARQEKLVLKSVLVGGAVNLALCPVLVHRWGPLGAAISNLCAEIAVHVVLIAFSPAGWRWGVLSTARGPAAVCAVAVPVAALGAAAWGPLAAAVLAAATYGAGLLWSRTVTVQEVRGLLRSAWPSRSGGAAL